MPTKDGFTPFTEPEIVMAYLQPVVERLAVGFHAACLNAKSMFTQNGWTLDAALSAFYIRKDVLEQLRGSGLQVEADDVEIERKALCGLLLKLPLVHLKIRKSKDGEIPPAGSVQGTSFYNWNLLVFHEGTVNELLPLHLMLLWNDNAQGELETLLLACVQGDTWRWRLPVFQRDRGSVNKSGSTEVKSADATPSQPYEEAFDDANEDVPLTLREEPSPFVEKPSEAVEIDDKDLPKRQKKAK